MERYRLNGQYDREDGTKPKILFFDLETDGLDPTVIHCLVTLDTEGNIERYNWAKIGNMLEGLQALADADMLIGHNIIAYDLPAIAKIHRGWETHACVRDTLLCTRLAWPHIRSSDYKDENFDNKMAGSHSLKAWGVRLGFEKYSYGEREDAWDEWNPEMEDYCERDVLITQRLWQEYLKSEFPDEVLEFEHEVHDLTEIMTYHGFYFDVEGGEKLYVQFLKEREELAEKLQEVFPPKLIEMKTKVKEQPFNPGSRLQIAERFQEKGWKPAEFTTDGRPKIDEGVLTELADDYPEAEHLKKYLLLQKRMGQLAEGKTSWLGMVDEGQRIHGRVISCGGTVSHRMAHHSPNLAQVPALGAEYGKECRSLFCVPEGRKLVGVDLSSIELRVLAHYLAYWDDGKYARECEDGDIHAKTQAMVGLTERRQAKIFQFSLIYGAGDQHLGRIVGGGLKEGKALRRKFYSKNPAFKKFLEQVKHKAKTEKRLVALDGRPLYPRSLHSAPNLLIQSGAAILAKRATLNHVAILSGRGIENQRDFVLVAHVHDEWQLEVIEEYAQETADCAEEAIRAAGKLYDLRVRLDGEAQIGNHWGETH